MADQRQDYAKVVARAWSDETFKAQLLNEPAAALAAEGAGRVDLRPNAFRNLTRAAGRPASGRSGRTERATDQGRPDLKRSAASPGP